MTTRLVEPYSLRHEYHLVIVSLFQHSLLYGALLGMLTCALFLVGAYLSPEVMLQGYPPDVKAKYGPMSAKARRHQKWLGIPVAIVLIGTLILAITQLPRVTGGLTFTAVFLCSTLMLLTLNVIDLVINDWLIFVTLQPRFVVLPGTEGMAGYRDYGFHFRQFLKGAFGSVAAGLVIAAIVMLIDAAVA